MISKFSALYRVKQTREEAALSVLREKRIDLSKAILIRDERAVAVEASAKTLLERENILFAAIMSKVVGSEKIEETKEKVVLLHKAHRQLEDQREMAKQHCIELEQEVLNAYRFYQATQRKREKFLNVLNDLMSERAVFADHKEEVELDDVYSRRGRSA